MGMRRGVACVMKMIRNQVGGYGWACGGLSRQGGGHLLLGHALKMPFSNTPQGEGIYCFVILRDGYEPSPGIRSGP